MDIYELLFPLFKRYLKLKLNRDSLEDSILGLYTDMKGDIIQVKEKQEESIDYSRTIQNIYQPKSTRKEYTGSFYDDPTRPYRIEYFSWEEFNRYT